VFRGRPSASNVNVLENLGTRAGNISRAPRSHLGKRVRCEPAAEYASRARTHTPHTRAHIVPHYCTHAHTPYHTTAHTHIRCVHTHPPAHTPLKSLSHTTHVLSISHRTRRTHTRTHTQTHTSTCAHNRHTLLSVRTGHRMRQERGDDWSRLQHDTVAPNDRGPLWRRGRKRPPAVKRDVSPTERLKSRSPRAACTRQRNV
jgi:hypothetical protein